jgi:hypothetical protein
MIRSFALVILILGACNSSSKDFKLYSSEIGFDASKPTLLVSLENCSYCFGEYQTKVHELDKEIFNVVIISSQVKKASLFLAPNQKSVFVDSEKIAIKMGLIESLPIIIFPNGEPLEIFSPNQLEKYAESYVP